MKRIIILSLCITLIFISAACTQKVENSKVDEPSATLGMMLGGTQNTTSQNDGLLGGSQVQVSQIDVVATDNEMLVANGETLQFSAVVSPEDANQAVIWSAEGGPATIDETGLLTATGVGKILVSATATDDSGVIGSVEIVSIPAAPNYTIDYTNAQTNEVVSDTFEYSTDGNTWTKGSGTNIKLVSGQNVQFRAIAVDSIPAGAVQTLEVLSPEAPAAPNFSIEAYYDQTHEVVPATTEYSIDSGKTWIKGAGSKIKLKSPQELQLRVAALGLIPAGDVQVLAFTKLPENYFLFKSGTITKYNIAGGKNVVIPDQINGVAVTKIDANAFLALGITGVTIPDSVTSIGSSAFEFNSLSSITIPNGVISIGEAAFDSNSLTSVTIGKSVKTIGDNAFSSNKISHVTIPDSVTKIGYGAFDGLTSDKITLGKGYSSCFVLDGNTVSGMICSLSSSLVIPSKIGGVAVTGIGESVFEGYRLKSVTIPNGITTIGARAFANNQLTSITIPKSVTWIGDEAFAEVNFLTSITMIGPDTNLGDNLLTFDNDNFRLSYYLDGAGTYDGKQSGSWTRQGAGYMQ